MYIFDQIIADICLIIVRECDIPLNEKEYSSGTSCRTGNNWMETSEGRILLVNIIFPYPHGLRMMSERIYLQDECIIVTIIITSILYNLCFHTCLHV